VGKSAAVAAMSGGAWWRWAGRRDGQVACWAILSEVNFESVAANLRESFRVIAASRQGGEVRELRGVSIASAGVAFQMFNAAFLASPVATELELEQRILTSAVYFQSRGLEWSYWVCEDWLLPKPRRRAQKIFERLGLRHAVDLPGMVAEKIAPPVKPLPEMMVRRVDGGNTRDAFCGIGSLCFHVTLPWFEEVFGNDAVWKGFASYVGYVGDEAVSTASVVAGGGGVGVYNVATVPGRQRCGYGEAVMRHALAEAYREHGTERVILQSTAAGLRLYDRMGFRTVTRMSVYST
jgi:ribosomal protein S18 acetylase RimI-like enzyme